MTGSNGLSSYGRFPRCNSCNLWLKEYDLALIPETPAVTELQLMDDEHDLCQCYSRNVIYRSTGAECKMPKLVSSQMWKIIR